MYVVRRKRGRRLELELYARSNFFEKVQTTSELALLNFLALLKVRMNIGRISLTILTITF